jgi:hypothetical protein
MKLELLVPGVKYAEEADLGSEMGGIARDLQQGFGAVPEQQTVGWFGVDDPVLAEQSAATVLHRSPRHSTEKRHGDLNRYNLEPAVALPQVRRTDGRRRTVHRGTTPTPFSTAAGHGCMNSVVHTPHGRRASERLAEVCLPYTQTSSSCPRLGSLRSSTRVRKGTPVLTPSPFATPAHFYNPSSLHSICISPASAAPAASF